MTSTSIIETFFDISGNYSPNGSAPYSYTIFDLEKKLFNSLNNFNNKYSQFLRCSNSITDSERDANINNILKDNNVNCNAASRLLTSDDIRIAYNEINNNITIYNTAFEKLKTIFPINQLNSETNNIRDIDGLVNKYQDVIKLRNSLDLKMMEINKTKDSKFMYSKGQNDSTVYTNILLTVLATSLIYYIFVKL